MDAKDQQHDDKAKLEAEAESKDQEQHTGRTDADRESKPRFHALGFSDEPDAINYRSIKPGASMMGPPSLSSIGGMHSGLPGAPMMQLGGKMQAPKAMGSGSGVKKAEAAPSLGVRSDKTKYVGVTPRDLPPPPFRLELHTHFHVKDEAIQRVCSVVGRKLCELDTDFVFSPEKCKWKVDYRHNGGSLRVNFNILIFRSNKEFVVEVQRRQGDITALMHLYADLKAFFKRNQLLTQKSSPAAGTKRPAPMTTPKVAVSPAQIQEAVQSVNGLLDSKFVDTQMQGVLGAISMTTNDEMRSALATLVPQLVVLGQSKNQHIVRLVGVALSRLCDHPECRQAFVQSEGWQFIVECAAGGVNVNPEVQRECLHVVESLCPLYHDELAKVEGSARVLELVKNWQTIEDPRLKKHACNAHKALQEAGVIA